MKAQDARLSVASDISVQRNFKPQQKYFAFGHTTKFILHLTPKESIYTWIAFYSRGHFHNNVTAVAKSPLTIPQTINYTNRARMGLKQFSLGYHRYLKGQPDIEEGWNLYGYAGFGLVFGRVLNAQSIAIDTNTHTVPVRNGEGNFKRLTVDLGIGWEKPLVGDFFFYTEARVWIPTTDYPSKYIFVNDNAPFVGMLCAGLRILF